MGPGSVLRSARAQVCLWVRAMPPLVLMLLMLLRLPSTPRLDILIRTRSLPGFRRGGMCCRMGACAGPLPLPRLPR